MFVLAAPGNAIDGGLLCGFFVGLAVFFKGTPGGSKVPDVVTYVSASEAEADRMKYLAEAEAAQSPSLEAVQELVVVAVHPTTDLCALASQWHQYVRIPAPPIEELCLMRA